MDRTCQASGISLSTDTAQGKLHHENVPFPPLVTPQGGSAGIFAGWCGRAAVLSSSGKGQHETLRLQQLSGAEGADRGHSSP